MLQIYNTLTKTKAEFKPIKPKQVNLYICGVTVYDYCHLGHARAYIAFDMIIRYLQFSGYTVNYVRNITDIDDKIIERAALNQENVAELTARFTLAMQEDFAALNLLKPNYEPKATEYIPQMLAMMQDLVTKGYAYQAENGDLYYDVRKFMAYGQLSHRNLEDLQAGARVEINTAKHCPLDFVLWKQAKAGEPAWPSPWGNGRPGWHSECAVMAMQYLGNTFDIHGGGMDLTFPHHENECAQAEAVTGQKFVNTWMHVGFLQVNQEKMAKSLGNFSTIREVLKKIKAEELRFFMLSSHYRSPLEYSPEQISLSRNRLEKFYITLRDLPRITVDTVAKNISEVQYFRDKFITAMDDDFNTPEALAVLAELSKEINKSRDQQQLEKAVILGKLLQQLGDVLGVLQLKPNEFLHNLKQDQITTIERLIEQRDQARANKDWAAADKIRAELTALGVSLEDAAQGTIWRKS